MEERMKELVRILNESNYNNYVLDPSKPVDYKLFRDQFFDIARKYGKFEIT